MNPLTYMYDSLRNLVTGAGTARDPIKANKYEFCELSYEQLTSAYRSNWIAKRVVDSIPEDATREWRAWQAEQDVIEVIEAEEKKHDLQRKTKNAMIRARLYGGAVLLLGIDGGGEPDQPLDYEGLSEGCLRFVAVFNRYELSAGPRIFDVQSEWFLRPSYYTIATPTVEMSDPSYVNASMVKIHPSRVVEFYGNELPDWRLQTVGAVWGDSVLQTLDDTLKGFVMTVNGVANLVNDAKVDVIKIPGLGDHLKTTATTNKLFERFAYAALGKSNLSVLLLDAAEEWDRKQTTFSGLPQVMQEFMTLVSGGAGIPVSRLMGSSPGKGLSTTGGGESDIHNYYDDVSSKQKTQYSPAMTSLDNVLQISATGTLDEGIYYDWNPLYQPDAKEVAGVAFSKAQTINLDVQMGLINPDALREARVNQLIEDGTYPGLSEAIDEHGAEPPEPEEPSPEDVQAHIGMMQKSATQLQQIGKAAQLPAPGATSDAWSEEARAAALEARRLRSSGSKDDEHEQHGLTNEKMLHNAMLMYGLGSPKYKKFKAHLLSLSGEK